MEQEQHVVSMKKQLKKLKTQLSDLEDRVHAVESTLRQQSSSTYQVANKRTQKVPIQISISPTKSVQSLSSKELQLKIAVPTDRVASRQLTVSSINQGPDVANSKSTLRSRLFLAMRHLINLVDSTQPLQIMNNKKTVNKTLQPSQVHHHHKHKANVVLVSTKKPHATVALKKLKLISTTGTAALIQRNQDWLQSNPTSLATKNPSTVAIPTTASQLMKSPLIPAPKSINVNSTVSHGVKQQAVYSNTPVKRLTSIPKRARLYEIVRPDFKGLCFPNDTELHNDYRFEATDRKVELNKLKTQAARLTRKGSAGVWVWNSKIQVGQYLSLRKISSTSSAKLFINRFSGLATDGKAGHSPPSTEMMPAKLLEKFEEFKGYRWYWFRDRWLLFTLHEE
ncbi:hypothetical protein BY996DRAFT_6409673 [Phakopsora pachyrhizi]|nr:hypothetical protein BY996DRAFT_6409673 [Phakopsora pachyrhizi]